MTQQLLTISEVLQLLNTLASTPEAMGFEPFTQTLHFHNGSMEQLCLRMPLVFPPCHSTSFTGLMEQLCGLRHTAVLILVQAGAAALGVVNNGELTRHRVIKKYMIRKCQGKSQINYLKSKGKSRAGSRVRLKNSVSFFEEINEVLQQWNVAAECDTILMSLPVNLKNLLFNSNVSTPFNKRDERIRKIPLDIRTPSLKELRHIAWVVSRGTVERPTDPASTETTPSI